MTTKPQKAWTLEDVNQRTVPRLSREEAAALISNALRDVEPPDNYAGGWSQILADFGCLSREAVRNYASRGRKMLTRTQEGA